MTITQVTVTSDREGVYDALVRMLEGIDFCDEQLLKSAFTDDVVFDLSGIDRSMGDFPPLEGRDVATTSLLDHVGRMDTLHAMTNFRVRIDGDAASSTCYLIGQHFRPGEGASADFGDHLWLGNRFETELRRESGHVWRVSHNRVFGVWALGNVAATKLD